MRHVIVLSLVVLLCAAPTHAGDDPWFARDKALHAVAGAALGAGGYGAGALASKNTRARIGVGLGVALGAGAAKEWHDRGGRGTPSWRDFAWDGVGAAAGVGVAWLIDRARHPHDTSTSRSGHTPNANGIASDAARSDTPRVVVLQEHPDAAADSGSVLTTSYRGVEGWALCCSVTR